MKTKPQKVQLDISFTLVFKILGIILGLIFLYMIRDIILVIFIAFIIASAVTPKVDWLERYRVPRILGALGIYFILIGLVSLIFIIVIPPITNQLGQLASSLPQYYEGLTGWIDGLNESSQSMTSFQGVLYKWTDNLADSMSGVFSFLGSFIGVLVGAFLAMVISFYMTIQKDSIKKLTQSVAPAKYQPYIIQLIRRIQEKMGFWITGQFTSCFLVGLLGYIALLAMGVRYALVLAVFVGLTEIIPYIGPWIGAIPVVFLSFLQSPILGLIALIIFIVVIQQIESVLITPMVMKRAVDLNPIITIIAIAIGGQLAGIAGAIIAIPLAVVISILLKDVIQYNQKVEKI